MKTMKFKDTTGDTVVVSYAGEGMVDIACWEQTTDLPVSLILDKSQARRLTRALLKFADGGKKQKPRLSQTEGWLKVIKDGGKKGK